MRARGSKFRGVIALSVVTGGLLFAAAPALAAAPEEPSAVTVEAHVPSPASPSTEAIFHGVLNPLAAAEPGTYEFLYKKSPTVCTGGSKAPASPGVSVGAEHEEVSETVKGLLPDTEYTVCLLARSGTKVEPANETVGPAVTFTTATPAEKPETKAATGETATTATLHGVLDPKAEAETGWYFVYSTGATCTSGGGETGHETPAKVKALPVAAEVTGLEPNKAYKFCLVATNTAEEATVGNEVPLKTLPLPPTIASEGTSGVKTTEATLEAQINPNNESTKYAFEYSTKETGGVLEAPIVKVPGSPELTGFPEQPASVALSGLEAGKTYFYRVVAENAQSETEHKPVGFPVAPAVQSFTTLPVPAIASVSGVTATTATFGGSLKPLNPTVATQYHFAYNVGPSCAGGGSTPTVEAGVGAGSEVIAKPVEVKELQPFQEYTVCLVLVNAYGSVEGPSEEFSTLAAPPKILSEGVSGVTPTEATLEAKVNPNNRVVTYAFEYATNPALTGATTVAGAAPLSGFELEGDTATIPTLTGLTVGETYYYRVVVTDTATSEVIDGQIQSLTPVGVPLVSTGAVQGVTEGAVMLPGTINPAGSSTGYHVAYISEAGYEEGLAANPADPFALAKVTLEETSVPSGFEAVSVTPMLRELTPGTTYEAELIAENATGRTVSAPIAFTATGTPPVGPGPEAEIPGPAPQTSPFAAATLPPVIPYTSIAALDAKEAKEGKATTPVTKSLTRAQKLSKALKACQKKAKSKRAGCQHQARAKYGASAKKGKTKK